jgi:hypothetical protein
MMPPDKRRDRAQHTPGPHKNAGAAASKASVAPYSVLNEPRSRTIYRISWRRPAWRPDGGNAKMFLTEHAARRLAARLEARGLDVTIFVAEVVEWREVDQ